MAKSNILLFSKQKFASFLILVFIFTCSISIAQTSSESSKKNKTKEVDLSGLMKGPWKSDSLTTERGKEGSTSPLEVEGIKVENQPRIVNTCACSGRIRVRIKVNRFGNVVDAEIVGGNTLNKCLQQTALDCAKSLKYEASAERAEIVSGVIEFSFRGN